MSSLIAHIDTRQRVARFKELEARSKKIQNSKPRFRGVIYGGYGVGKTTAAVALASAIIEPDQKIILVDVSEGYVSLHAFPALWKRVEYFPFTSLEDLSILAEAIKLGALGNVGAVILDEATAMAEHDLNYVEGKKPQDEKTGKPEWTDYRQSKYRFGDMLNDFYRQVDAHVILTAHTREKRNTNGTVIHTDMGFNPALGEAIARVQHVVAYMSARSVEENGNVTYIREFQVNPTTMFAAKNRMSLIPVKMSPTDLIETTVAWRDKGGPTEDPIAVLNRERSIPAESGEVKDVVVQEKSDDDGDESSAFDDEPVYVEE